MSLAAHGLLASIVLGPAGAKPGPLTAPIVDVAIGFGRMSPGDRSTPLHGAARLDAGLRIHAGTRFRADVGARGEYRFHAWLSPDTGIGVVRRDESERYGGTAAGELGSFVRAVPLLRLGLENEIAFGYLFGVPGAVFRFGPLECLYDTIPCGARRIADLGLNLDFGIGALVQAWRALVVGVELGFDSSWFPTGHPGLARWVHAFGLHFVIGWSPVPRPR